MKIDAACVTCIVNQSLKVADAVGADDELRQKLYDSVAAMSHDFSFSQTPPEIAADVYKKMAQIVGKDDLYDAVKKHSTQKAKLLLLELEKKLSTCKGAYEQMLVATKTAVAGNVIDLAAEVRFDLDEELAKIFDEEFAHNDFELFFAKLQDTKEIVVLGDNAGEHLFDKLFMQTLKELFPHVRLYYFVRGEPIINDVTLQEAKEAGIDAVAEIIDSGVDTPGFAYSRATKEAQNIFDNADLIVSKGMGNYESLSPSHRGEICFLLKVKCNVVANSLGKEVGDTVCKMV